MQCKHKKPLCFPRSSYFLSPIALDETIVPPDVPSYLSSQGTLSDRQEAVVRGDNQHPNGHIDSNGENQFLLSLILHLNLMQGWKKCNMKYFCACYELSDRSLQCNSPAFTFMQNKDSHFTKLLSPRYN